MEIIGKLIKKTFINTNGEVVEFYVLQFELDGGETLDLNVKSDKAKILLMSEKLKNK